MHARQIGLELVLKSKKLSQSAVDLSIHSEPYRRVGGDQTVGLANQVPTIDRTRFVEYRENMLLNRMAHVKRKCKA
jgi:hypothetical protein